MGFVVLHPAYSLSWLGFSGPYVIIVLPLKTYILYLSLLQEVTKSLTSLYPMQKGRNADACYFANEATVNDLYSGKNGQGFLFHYSSRFH